MVNLENAFLLGVRESILISVIMALMIQVQKSTKRSVDGSNLECIDALAARILNFARSEAWDIDLPECDGKNESIKKLIERISR